MSIPVQKNQKFYSNSCVSTFIFLFKDNYQNLKGGNQKKLDNKGLECYSIRVEKYFHRGI